MSQEIEELKKEVNELRELSESERKEILSDLQFLEESNKNLEKYISESKKAKQLGIASFICGALVIIYLAFKLW